MTGQISLTDGAVSLTERGGRRRQEILAAARILVSKKGFEACRMDEVAAAVGVTKPAVYRYFPGKERLIHALLEEDLLNPSQAMFADIRAFEGPLRDMLDLFARRTLEIQDRGLSRGYMVLAMDESRRRPEIAALIRDQVLAPGIGILGAAFVKAMASGELRSGEDPAMMVRLFFAPFMQIALIRGGVGVPMTGNEELAAYLRLHVEAFMRAFGT